MNKLVILIALMLVPILLPGQSKNLWNDNFTHTSALTEYSKELDVSDFSGSALYQMSVGNIAGTGDTLLFYNQYWVNEGWADGDTITWFELPTFADDSLSTTDTFILPQSADSAKTYVWILDPSKSYNIMGQVEKIRIKKVDNGTVSHAVDMTVTYKFEER